MHQRHDIGAQSVVIAVCAMLVIVVLGSFGYDTYQRHHHEIARAERETENARNVLVEHTARTFESVAGALRMVAELREEMQESNGRISPATIHETLRAIDAGSPVLHGVGWADAAGNRIASSLFRDPPPLNIADQEHFRAHVDNPNVGVHVGTPIQARIDGTRVIAVSQRFNGSDDEFNGIINALVRLDYFANFYDSLDLGPKRIIGLAKRDGTIVVQSMKSGNSSGSIADRRLITTELPRAAVGTFHSSGAAGKHRIWSYGAVPGLPLIIYAGMERGDALAQFYTDLRNGASRTALVVLALMGGAWLLVGLMRERDRKFQGQSLLANVVATSDDAIITNGLDGRITSWNAGAARLFGRDAADVIGSTIAPMVPADRLVKEAEIVELVGRGEGFANIETQYLRRDGSLVDVILTVSPLRDAKGSIVGSSRILRDITERKRAEVKFRHLLESAPDGMVIANGMGRIVLVNAQTETLFGYDRAELLGQPIEILLPERFRAERADNRIEFAAGSHGRSRQLFARRSDGTEFPAEITLNALFTEEGMLVSTAIRDITDRRRRERELAAARDAADRANRAKSEFLSCMSHELRTPLNAVLGFGQMLELDPHGRLTAQQKEYCRHIVSSGHHLLSLVNDVLDLAQVESGNVKLTPERIMVDDTLAEVARTMSALAEKAGLNLEIAASPHAPDVRADGVRLRQVLINLVSNAIKYNRRGGSVTLSARSEGEERVRFMVSDTGIGIDPAKQEHLFQPFQRLGAEFSGIEGSGIGLAITRRLVAAMDGAIGFSSDPGRGSTFWIDLPAESERPASADRPATRRHALVPRVLAGASSSYSLLYVEDNPANLQLMQHLVGTLSNVEMLSAATPQLGLELAAAHRPDVIVLDLNLPGMSGYDVLDRLKEMPETHDIPVMALTSAAMPYDVQRGLAAGFYRYLTKPIDVKAFLAAVDEILSTDQAQRAAG